MPAERPVVANELSRAAITEKLGSTLDWIRLGASSSFVDSSFFEAVHAWHYVNGIDIEVFNKACSDFLSKEKLSDAERQVMGALIEKTRHIFLENDERMRESSIEHWRQQSAKEFSEEERIDALRAYAANTFFPVFKLKRSLEKRKNPSDFISLEIAKLLADMEAARPSKLVDISLLAKNLKLNPSAFDEAVRRLLSQSPANQAEFVSTSMEKARQMTYGSK